MAEIPRRKNMTTPPSPVTVRIPEVTGIGEGLGKVGETLTRMGHDAQLRDATVAANRELSQVRSDWADRIRQMEQEAPLGAPGFEDQVLSAFDEQRGDIVARIAPALQPDFEAKLDAERLRLQDRAGNFEVTSALEKRRQDLQDVIGLNANSVRTDPTQFQDALATARDAIKATGLRADIERDVLAQSDNTLAAAYIRGLNEADAKLAKKILESGQLDELLTPETKNTLVNDNQVELRRLDAERKAALTAAKWQIRDVVDLLRRGFNPGRERLLEIEKVARMDPKLADDLANAAQLFDFQRVAVGWTPAELQDWINTERGVTGQLEGMTTARADRIEMAETLLGNMTESLRKDPLSWAARAGVHGVQPLNLVGDNAAASISQRRTDAEEVAAYYGISPKYLTDDEATQAASVIRTLDVDGKMILASALTSGFGDAAPRVFAEFADAGSATFSHAGGLVMMGAYPAARDVFVGMKAREDGIKAPPATATAGSQASFAGAFALSPATAAAHRDAAEAIYIARAQRRGLDTTDATTFNADLWERANQEAAGAVYIEDRRYGGIDEYNGWPVVIPPQIEAGKFDEVVAKIEDKDLAGARHTDGKPFKATELNDAYLVSVGDRLYRISLTDPADGDPLYVPDNGGTAPYILDLRDVLPAIAGRPRRQGAPMDDPGFSLGGG